MGDVKATTIAQRFGFKDPQLSTPAHDEIMLAIAAYPIDLLRSFSSTPRACVTNVEWEWPIVSENVRTGQKFPVGFVDMRMDWTQEHTCKKLGKKDLVQNYLDTHAKEDHQDRFYTHEECAILEGEHYRWARQKCSLYSCDFQSGCMLIEVKPFVPSLGELMRQIQMYRTYVDAWYVVATPDETFFKEVRGMGIDCYNPQKLVDKYRKQKGPKK
jgi:hypothetical protein